MATYSKEFKEEALKLSNEVGVKAAAAQLGIPYYTLADWRSSRRHIELEASMPKTAAEQAARIRELERKNRELEEANDILKDALGFFAKGRKK